MRRDVFLGNSGDVARLVARAHPGDIILFKGDLNDVADEAIQTYQTIYNYPAEACAYVHAALYIRDDLILHAVPWTKSNTTSGVQLDSLDAYKGTGCSAVLLRCPQLSKVQCDYIVANATGRLGSRYDYIGILRRLVWRLVAAALHLIPWQTARWKRYRKFEEHYVRMYCSGLIRTVFIDALGVHGNPLVTGRIPSPLYTPADIYVNQNLVTIHV